MAIDTREASEERAKFRRIGCGLKEYGKGGPLPHPSVVCDFFAEFMRRNGEWKDEGRVLEWAERFRRGDEFQFADRENRKILLDIMVEGTGDGTARHFDEEDIKRLAKKFDGCGVG